MMWECFVRVCAGQKFFSPSSEASSSLSRSLANFIMRKELKLHLLLEIFLLKKKIKKLLNLRKIEICHLEKRVPKNQIVLSLIFFFDNLSLEKKMSKIPFIFLFVCCLENPSCLIFCFRVLEFSSLSLSLSFDAYMTEWKRSFSGLEEDIPFSLSRNDLHFRQTPALTCVLCTYCEFPNSA